MIVTTDSPTGVLRQGLSLLEAMFALAILAVVLSGVISNAGTLEQSSARSDEQQVANDLLRSVMERIQSVDYDLLGRTGHWSEPHFLTDAGGSELDGLDISALRAMGLADRNLPFDELDLYIEYYRGVDNSTGDGLLQRADESDADYRSRVTDAALNGPNPWRLADRQAIENEAERPVVIRLVLRFGGAFWGEQVMERFTARRRTEI